MATNGLLRISHLRNRRRECCWNKGPKTISMETESMEMESRECAVRALPASLWNVIQKHASGFARLLSKLRYEQAGRLTLWTPRTAIRYPIPYQLKCAEPFGSRLVDRFAGAANPARKPVARFSNRVVSDKGDLHQQSQGSFLRRTELRVATAHQRSRSGCGGKSSG